MPAKTIESDEPVTEINVVPLVDVCLVLVIIFMVAAPIFSQPNLKVALPKAHTTEGEDAENVALTITADGRWAINEQEVSPQDAPAILQDRLRKSREKLVILRLDRQTRHASLVEAMRIAKAVGAKQITVATEQKR